MCASLTHAGQHDKNKGKRARPGFEGGAKKSPAKKGPAGPRKQSS